MRAAGFLRSVSADRSWRSTGSHWSALCHDSTASAVSSQSLLSFLSVLSIGSAGSVLSIGSAGSILSIGSAGSVLGGSGAEGQPNLRIERLAGVLALAGVAAAARA